MSALRILLVGTLAALVGVVAASAQQPTLRPLTGTVRDASGATLPGVVVVVTGNPIADKARRIVTDASGSYRVADLPQGEYVVTFSLPGFRTVTRDITIPATQPARVDVAMRVGQLRETIPRRQPPVRIVPLESESASL